ncbi:MAG: hypothetical protein IJX80_08955 [Clostridia bacterium]|nr:hypothetical protein [Clostridia bacterium]
MKRFIKILLPVLLIAVLALTLAACDDGQSSGGVTLGNPDANSIRYSDGFITWNTVEGASKYRICINEGNDLTVVSPQYPYAESATSFTVYVTALDASEKASETVSKTFYPLATIQNVNVANDGSFSWEAVTGATSYEVQVDGGNIQTVATTEFAGLTAGAHTVKVRPIVAGDTTYFSSWSAVKNITVLNTVDIADIKYSDGVITWKYVSGAACYEIAVNGQVLASDCVATQYSYNSQRTDFEVTVKAIGNHNTTYDGVTSAPKKFIFLDPITDLAVTDGILNWSPIENATGYQVKVGTQIFTVTECKYDKLTAGRANDVQVKAIADGSSDFFSEWSETKSITILISPIIQWNNLELDGDKKQNVVWDTVPGAYGYTVRLTAPGATPEIFSYSETQRFFEYDYLMTGDYTVEIKAMANPTADTVYDSVYSAPITVRRLESPTFSGGAAASITSTADNLAAGFQVNFKGVSGASGYMLYRDNNLVRTATGDQTSFSDASFHDADSLDAHEYNYWIRAKGSNGIVNGVVTLDSLTQNALNFTISVLATPMNTDISGYTFSYGAVAGSYGYAISAERIRSINGLSIDLSDMEAGSFDLMVCAKGNGSNVLPSNFTTPIRVFRLAAPTNVRIDTANESDGRLIFDQVNYATGYNVRIGLDGEEVPSTQLQNLNSKISTQGTTFYVQSTANYFNTDRTEYYMSSIYGATSTFIKLKAPTFGEQPFSNNQLVWNMEGSFTPTYEVYDGNGTLMASPKDGKAYNISSLEGGQTYVFQVKAVGDGQLYSNVQYIDSELSEAISVYKLATPNVRIENGKYVWNAVASATSYSVYVDGELKQAEYNQAAGVFSYTPGFDRLKTYTVQVVAIGNGGIGSQKVIDSKPCEIETVTKQLNTPTIAYGYTEQQYSTTGEIQVTVTAPVPYATGYVFDIGGRSQTTTSDVLVCSSNTGSTGTFSVFVYALGGSFDEDGCYYIDSQTAGGKNMVTVLGAVNKNNVNITAYNELVWTTVAGAAEYQVSITINGITKVTIVNGNVTRVNIKELFDNQTFQYVTINAEIQALGNGSTIISSEKTSIQKTNQTIR